MKSFQLNNLFLKLCFILIFFFIYNINFSQSKKELERKKEKLKKDILYKNQLLKITKRNKTTSLNQLIILNQKIKKREELISTIKKEIYFINREINQNKITIKKSKEFINILKEEYERMLVYAFKTRNRFNKTLFIFSSQDLNQAYKRLNYIKQYSSYRKKQVKLIKQEKLKLEKRNEKLNTQKQEKNQLLNIETNERKNLAHEKLEQNKLYTNLRKKENGLRREINKKKKERKNLQNTIEKIIRESIERERKKLKKTTIVNTKKGTDFEYFKGKLPWPVKNGMIISKFGITSHEILKDIKIKNNGITIETKPKTKVNAVHNGVVSAVVRIPGSGNVIMLRHGKYITVYGQLGEIFVKKGDIITKNQAIGIPMTIENRTELQFEIRKEFELINPEFWITNSNQ